ncbi:CYTH domain-containing protein [Synechococcus sp. MIT S9503]|uniref:CYTH domain-containing protein n=1 Tax=Synechococcus sp. MIT S9503 TaxID=3082547 RepID=UPI0039A6E194
MPLEIERRFLVTGSGWRVHAGEPQHLRQGYLASSEQGFTVRVRLRADGKAWLTLKTPAEGIARHEFEYELPSDESETLWSLVPHRLIKTRYALSFPGGDWVVDCFEADNAPLVLAEVELGNAEDPFERPEWCGLEVTGDGQLSNAALAHQPVSSWTRAMRLRHGLEQA